MVDLRAEQVERIAEQAVSAAVHGKETVLRENERQLVRSEPVVPDDHAGGGEYLARVWRERCTEPLDVPGIARRAGNDLRPVQGDDSTGVQSTGDPRW